MLKPADTFNSVGEAFLAAASERQDEVLYRQPVLQSDGSRVWASRTYGEVAERVLKVAGFLNQWGLKPGDKVAIVSNTRPEWVESELAALLCGAAVVSVYQSLTTAEVGYILYDSGARIVFAENQEQLDKLRQVALHPVAIPETDERAATETAVPMDKVICFETAVWGGMDAGNPDNMVGTGALLKHDSNAVPEIMQFSDILSMDVSVRNAVPLKPDDLASIVYTSGTTGPPKGVLQTHYNHLSNVRQTFESGMLDGRSSLILFLPLAHSFAKLMSYLGFLGNVAISFPMIIDRKSSRVDPKSIARDIRTANAEIVPIVPRFLEKMSESIIGQSKKPGVVNKIVHLTMTAAEHRYAARKSGRTEGRAWGLAFKATERFRVKIRERLFGNRFRLAISGGAKLSIDVLEFFDSLEIEVLEGFGLTETAVATNVNRLGQKRIGTVGPVLASDILVKLTSEGEVLFKGPNVAKGYHQRAKATAEAWDQEGWFHSGDLGSIDSDGFLTITGRKKELIVTSGGKKIAPMKLEELLKRSNLISQAVVVGDGRPFCIAILTLNNEAAAGELTNGSGSGEAQNPQTGVTGELPREERLKQLITTRIEELNQLLPSYETIKNYWVAPEEFTVENGLLTPTFKVKRRAVEERFRTQIDELYTKTYRPAP